MPKFQYAGTRAKACIHSVDVTSGGTTTAASAGNWKFYLQFRNRAGYSLLSDPVGFTLLAGQKVAVTIPADARRDGEHIEEWIIAGTNLSGFNVDARVLAAIPAFNAQGYPVSLPLTVTFSTDEHFKLEASVVAESNLPTNRLPGMRRGVSSTGKIVSWNSLSNTWSDVVPPKFTSYVPSSEGLGGANIDIGKLPSNYEGVIYPDYDSGESLPVRGKSIGYWLCNDTDFDIPMGTPVEFTFRAGKYTDFSNKILITPKGYADVLTGELDITGEGDSGFYEGLNQDFEYQKFTNEIILEKPLPPERAYYFEVTPQFTDAMLGNLVLQGETLTVYARFGEERSSYAPGTYGIGDYLYPEPTSRKRIYPTLGVLMAEASPGAGLVKQREFRKSGSELILGFDANTPNQQLVISGDGNCFLADTVPPYAARRAFVGTVNGVGKPTAFQYSLAVNSGKVVRLQITHPTKIRDNYPDVVAGSELGDFNADKVYVYLKNTTTGAILQYVEDIVPGAATSSIAVGGLAGTSIASLPSPDSDFGLYEPQSFTASTESVSSSLPTATVQVAIAYYFENTVTSLNHTGLDDTTKCITEIESGLADRLQQVATNNMTPENAIILGFGFS